MGKRITKYEKTYCDFASQKVWKINPPVKIRGIMRASSRCLCLFTNQRDITTPAQTMTWKNDRTMITGYACSGLMNS